MKITINGKPIADAEFKTELERAVTEAILEKVTTKIASSLSTEDKERLTVRLLVNTPSEISFHASGPEEVMDKVRTISDQPLCV